MTVQKVPQNWGDMLNLKPADFGTNAIPPDPVPWDPGIPERQYVEGDWGKWDIWQQMLLQLKDVPFPKLPEDIGKSLVLRPTFDENSGYSVQWETPAKLETPRAFSITGDGEAPAVQFDGTQNVTLNLTNLQAAKWKTPRTMTFTGPDATGSVTFDGSGDVTISLNVLNSDNASHAETVTLSPDTGNLLQQRDNGLFYGITAPTDVAILYVDAVNGLDTNVGTRASPMRTIKAALNRGPAGIIRSIALYEGQNHLVDCSASDPATVRGGSCEFYPYGPIMDTIPAPPGDSNVNTAAARDLNTRITAGTYQSAVSGGATLQFGEALVVSQAGRSIFHALTITAGTPNGSADAISSAVGMLTTSRGPGSVTTIYCNIVLPDASSRILTTSPSQELSLTWAQSTVSGSGKLMSGVNKGVTFSVLSTITAASTLVGYVTGAVKTSANIYNMNTDLDPNLFP